MASDRPIGLGTGKNVTLTTSGGVVGGRIEIGPNTGPPIWHVTKIVIRTSRPGQAPVPRFDLYLDQENDVGRKGLSYDGSSNESDFDLYLQRGQKLIAIWTGGLAGDSASISLDGERLLS